MICQRIGIWPISTIGFGRISVSSASRLPNPPARIPTFIDYSFCWHLRMLARAIAPDDAGVRPRAPPMNRVRRAICSMLDSRMQSQFTSFDVVDWSASAVVVAPHPDDETLGCGGVAIKKLKRGAKVHF